MQRKDAMPYIAHYLDDCFNVLTAKDMPENARLIGWQCGNEPLFVAVWSYLDVELDDSEASEIAEDWLIETGWFGKDGCRVADYFL